MMGQTLSISTLKNTKNGYWFESDSKIGFISRHGRHHVALKSTRNDLDWSIVRAKNSVSPHSITRLIFFLFNFFFWIGKKILENFENFKNQAKIPGFQIEP